MREHADTESSEEEAEDDAMGSTEGVRRVEEIDFEHPLIFMQEDRPGVMFEADEETNKLRILRILDLNVDEPETDEEFYVDTVDGNPRWQRCLRGEPEGEEAQVEAWQSAWQCRS